MRSIMYTSYTQFVVFYSMYYEYKAFDFAQWARFVRNETPRVGGLAMINCDGAI